MIIFQGCYRRSWCGWWIVDCMNPPFPPRKHPWNTCAVCTQKRTNTDTKRLTSGQHYFPPGKLFIRFCDVCFEGNVRHLLSHGHRCSGSPALTWRCFAPNGVSARLGILVTPVLIRTTGKWTGIAFKAKNKFHASWSDKGVWWGRYFWGWLVCFVLLI